MGARVRALGPARRAWCRRRRRLHRHRRLHRRRSRRLPSGWRGGMRGTAPPLSLTRRWMMGSRRRDRCKAPSCLRPPRPPRQRWPSCPRWRRPLPSRSSSARPTAPTAQAALASRCQRTRCVSSRRGSPTPIIHSSRRSRLSVRPLPPLCTPAAPEYLSILTRLQPLCTLPRAPRALLRACTPARMHPLPGGRAPGGYCTPRLHRLHRLHRRRGRHRRRRRRRRRPSGVGPPWVVEHHPLEEGVAFHHP